MKHQMRFVGMLAACLLPTAWGASITYLNGAGVTNLSDSAAWDGGVAPGEVLIIR